MTENATCVKSLGLFRLTPSYLNYTETILNCQNLSGDLADVTSEYRTVKLAQFINTSMPNDWYKAVFVGLDDLEVEGVFRNSYGKPLTCSRSVFIPLPGGATYEVSLTSFQVQGVGTWTSKSQARDRGLRHFRLRRGMEGSKMR